MRNNIITEVSERAAIAEHLIHYQKLALVKPRIDNKAPRIMRHLQINAKKSLEELKVQAEIQRKNNLLLLKLKYIKNRRFHPIYFAHRNSSSYRENELIRIENDNNKLNQRIHSAKPYYSSEKHKKDYNFAKNLSLNLSKNSRRIPRTTTYNPEKMLESLGMNAKKLARNFSSFNSSSSKCHKGKKKVKSARQESC